MPILGETSVKDVEKALEAAGAESGSDSGLGGFKTPVIQDASDSKLMTNSPCTRRSSNDTAVEPAPFPDPGPPPDGGLTACLQVLAGVCANALTWGYATSFGVFQSYYVGHLGHEASDIAWIGGMQTFLLFFVGTFSGRATDAGLSRITIAIGSLTLLVGIFMTSLATEYWQIFLAQGVCAGLGGGILFMPVLAVVGTYFHRYRSFAVGLGATGTGVGGLIFPSIIQHLIPKIGFGWAVRVMAFVSLILVLIINVTIKPRLPPRKFGPLIDWAAFKDAAYSLYTVATFLFFWALFVGFDYINLYARNVFGFSDLEAVNLLLVMNGIGIPSRMICNWIADRWSGPINAIIPASACLSLIFFCWIAVDSHTGLYVFAVIYGISAAATQGLFVGSLASVTPDLSKIGIRMGMVFTIVSFSSLSGPSIAGAIVQANNGSYVRTQIWAGCMMVGSCLAFIAARLCRTGFTWKAKM